MEAPLRVDHRTLVVLLLSSIGASGAVLALGAMVGLSESHSGTPAMIRHAQIQLVVAASGILWSIVAGLRWRTTTASSTVLAIVAVGQLCLWELLRRYDIVRAWNPAPSAFASVSLVSVFVAWSLVIGRLWSK
jgi:hypothetical protein